MFYDGGEIDVDWDHHDRAIAWYTTFLGWELKRKESWWPDQRVQDGKMTHLGYGTWLNSVLAAQKLPFHFAEKGTVDPNLRWCWRTKNLHKVHDLFTANEIRVTDIYTGPDGKQYFDFWETIEGTRLTAEGDDTIKGKGFRPSCIRMGVKDLRQAAQWYMEFVGMVIIEDHTEDGYLIMALQETMRPKEKMFWILEELPGDASPGVVDGPIRPLMLLRKRDAFFTYHQFLKENGIKCGEFGGFVEKGRVLFHFYDPDGNRLNVCHC
jgi:catechol 2,3-dioxygenase-like lactoylglutathione lyase family enzyme